MKLCTVLLINSSIFILAPCKLNPQIDGAPAAHFHWAVAIMGLVNRDLPRSQLSLTTAQVYHKLDRAPEQVSTQHTDHPVGHALIAHGPVLCMSRFWVEKQVGNTGKYKSFVVSAIEVLAQVHAIHAPLLNPAH